VDLATRRLAGMQDFELMVQLALFADDLLRSASRVGPPLARQ
jgi:hypothetical protein